MQIRNLTLALGLLATPLVASAQTVRSGSGANPAAIQTTVDQYRADLGGNNGIGGSFASGRREINWDGVGNAFTAGNNLPANFFNANSPRGLVLSGSVGGFQVSDRASGGNGAGVRFDNLNATYSSTFQTFSAQKLFTAIGTNVYDVSFFVPGTTTPALVTGFGSVFTDVDVLGSTTIEYFNHANASLGVFNVPVADLGLSFLGVSFSSAEVARVRITQGSAALGAGVNDEGSSVDVVAADDFIYGEPQAAAPEPGTLAFLALGGTLTFLRRRIN